MNFDPSKREFIPWNGGFRREVQPRRQHWFLNEKSGFPFRTPAFCSVSRGQRRLGEEEYRAPSVTPGVALRPRTQVVIESVGDQGQRVEQGFEWPDDSALKRVEKEGEISGRHRAVSRLGITIAIAGACCGHARTGQLRMRALMKRMLLFPLLRRSVIVIGLRHRVLLH